MLYIAAGVQQIQVFAFGTFWNFFPTTLDLWLVEYSYAEPAYKYKESTVLLLAHLFYRRKWTLDFAPYSVVFRTQSSRKILKLTLVQSSFL